MGKVFTQDIHASPVATRPPFPSGRAEGEGWYRAIRRMDKMTARTLTRWFLTVILCTIAGCQGDVPGDDVLVRAWGKPLISREAFESRLGERAPECRENRTQDCVELKRNLLHMMIAEALLLNDSEKRGVTVPPDELRDWERLFLEDYRGAEEALRQMGIDLERWRASLEGQLRAQSSLGEILRGVKVEDEEVEAHYRDHRELFVQPREVRVRQIVTAQSEDAVELLRRIERGEDFSFLAKQYSLSPEAALGGDLGYLRPGQVPLEIEEVAFSLEVGEVSEAIPSAYGFHIIRVEERREPRELTFSEVKDEIRRRLLNEKAQRDYEAWLSAQWKEANVEILDATLGSLKQREEHRS